MQAENFIQLELPLFPEIMNPLKQTEQAIQSMLDLTWNIVLAHISLPSTKELMRQHGKLVAFYNGKAQIKVSSLPVFRVAIEKTPEVESAFEKAFGVAIKVGLEV